MLEGEQCKEPHVPQVILVQAARTSYMIYCSATQEKTRQPASA